MVKKLKIMLKCFRLNSFDVVVGIMVQCVLYFMFISNEFVYNVLGMVIVSDVCFIVISVCDVVRRIGFGNVCFLFKFL